MALVHVCAQLGLAARKRAPLGVEALGLCGDDFVEVGDLHAQSVGEGGRGMAGRGRGRNRGRGAEGIGLHIENGAL